MIDKDYHIKLLTKSDPIPYQLLLLADETEEAINRYIHTSQIYLLTHQGRAIGVYALYPVNTSQAEIKNIAVDEAVQGMGIGTWLLNDAATKAKAQGYKELLISTADGSRQIKLYRKQGFADFKIIPNFFIDNYPEPIYEDGAQLKDMMVLIKSL